MGQSEIHHLEKCWISNVRVDQVFYVLTGVAVVIARLDSENSAARGPPRPLPMNMENPTFLTIICTPDAKVDEVAALITHLAPIDKK